MQTLKFSLKEYLCNRFPLLIVFFYRFLHRLDYCLFRYCFYEQGTCTKLLVEADVLVDQDDDRGHPLTKLFQRLDLIVFLLCLNDLYETFTAHHKLHTEPV